MSCAVMVGWNGIVGKAGTGKGRAESFGLPMFKMRFLWGFAGSEGAGMFRRKWVGEGAGESAGARLISGGRWHCGAPLFTGGNSAESLSDLLFVPIAVKLDSV